MPARSTQQTGTGASLVSQAWLGAVEELAKYLKRFDNPEVLLPSEHPLGEDANPPQMRLLYGLSRNWIRIDAAIRALSNKPPKATLRAILMVSGFELLDAKDDAERALITHHAVEGAKRLVSSRECGFVNAMMHRLPAALETPPRRAAGASLLSWRYSHPLRWVEHWLEEFGEAKTEALLQWNQQPPPVYARLEPGVEPVPGLEATRWEGFHRVGKEGWEPLGWLLDERKAYVQDPFTAHPVDLLDPKPGETILDLCSAPGGKARMMLSRMDGRGTLVCVEGFRMDDLRENLEEMDGPLTVHIVEADAILLTRDYLEELDLPLEYDAVMIDAPCSNSGVFRRRVDARWNLLATGAFEGFRHSTQRALLASAATLVKPFGRLVYSTCSIEAVENADAVQNFLSRHPGFRLGGSRMSYPWKDGHDGGGAFRLERTL